ncbi:MAG: hypothetical protein Q9163_002840 [Psora crenata]
MPGAANDPISKNTLPPPQTFDILQTLYPLLTRLLQPPPAGHSPTPNLGSDSATSLSPKDLAASASTVLLKIQKARQAVEGLEGIDVSVEEQEDIIRELEEEAQRGQSVLSGLQGKAKELLMMSDGSGGFIKNEESMN